MMPWGYWGGHWEMMVVMWLFWIIVVVGLALLIAWAVQQGGRRGIGGGPPHEQDPLTILKRRYARGEITREEYERMRKELT